MIMMKMKIKMKRLLCVVLCLLLGLMLCACASEAKLSESEISALRSRYPAMADTGNESNTLICYKSESFDEVKQTYQKWLGVVEATVTGTDGSVLEIAPADGMAKEKLNTVFLKVHIDSVIAKQDDVDLSGDVTLYVGSQQYLGSEFHIEPGTKLVLGIYPLDMELDLEKCPKDWGAAVHYSYYLTEDQHLISLYDQSGPAEKNGVTLNAFRSELKNLYR